MSRSASEQFTLLLSDSRPRGTEVLTRRAGVSTDLGPVLLGVDAEGRRHLLVPVPPPGAPEDRLSRGINLDQRELTVGAEIVRYADLSCTIGRLVGAFDQLVDDILGRLTRDPRAGLHAVVAALDDWRALLRRALDDLSREEVIGLIGELEVMLLLAASDPVAAVMGWTGPTSATHDFSWRGRDIEVKATAAVNATSIRISNLDQLDPALSTTLHLAVAHLLAASDAPDIEARITALVLAGVPEDALETRLNDLGYFRGMNLNVPTRYSLREIRWWEVVPTFPGLRSSDVAMSRLMGIDAVSYNLLLGALPPAMPPAEAERCVRGWSA